MAEAVAEQTKHTFTFEDGKNVEFNEFTVERHNRICCGQSGKIPGVSAGQVMVYVSKDIFDFERKARYDSVNTGNYSKDILVGVLDYRSAIGIPAGAYVPIKWNQAMRRFDLFTLGLTNDKLFLNKSIATKDVIDKVEKAIKEDSD